MGLYTWQQKHVFNDPVWTEPQMLHNAARQSDAHIQLGHGVRWASIDVLFFHYYKKKDFSFSVAVCLYCGQYSTLTLEANGDTFTANPGPDSDLRWSQRSKSLQSTEQRLQLTDLYSFFQKTVLFIRTGWKHAQMYQQFWTFWATSTYSSSITLGLDKKKNVQIKYQAKLHELWCRLDLSLITVKD